MTDDRLQSIVVGTTLVGCHCGSDWVSSAEGGLSVGFRALGLLMHVCYCNRWPWLGSVHWYVASGATFLVSYSGAFRIPGAAAYGALVRPPAGICGAGLGPLSSGWCLWDGGVVVGTAARWACTCIRWREPRVWDARVSLVSGPVADLFDLL